MTEQNAPEAEPRSEGTDKPLSDDQVLGIGRELIRWLKAGATIKSLGSRCLEPEEGGHVFGGLEITYPEK
ncbi:MAG TPA: hypothetical protein VJ528_14305 [Geothrix sp.]|nr:hypothetical protein [Geothrix sp.]